MAWLGAGGILAGSALAWLLSPAERRARTGRALRGAAERAGAEARAVSTRAGEALHDAPDRLRTGARAAVAQAEALPARAREVAERGRLELEARGWSPRQAVLGVAGGALIGRAVLGRGLLRVPAGLLGASILARAASSSPSLRRGMRRAGDTARDAAERLRAGEGQGAGGGGSPRRSARPEVQEVKSPAELEPGIATGRPEPTFAGRADRSGPHMRGAGPAGAAAPRRDQPEEEGILSAPSTDDVRREGFDAPAAGAGVREGELGAVLPHEGAPPESGAEAPRILGPDGAPATSREPRTPGAERRDPRDDEGT